MASQPTAPLAFVDNLTKLLASTMGRDKASKLLHYGSKVVQHVLEARIERLMACGAPAAAVARYQDWDARVASFEGGVASGRKVMRFGRALPGYTLAFVELYRSLQQARSATAARLALDVVGFLNKFCMANYFLLDHLNWAARLKLLSNAPLGAAAAAQPPAATKQPPAAALSLPQALLNNGRLAQYAQWSAKAWMLGVCMALVTDLHALLLLSQQEEPLQREARTSTSTETAVRARQQLAQLHVKRREQFLALVANLCDLFTAMALAGLLRLTKGTLGTLGSINALIGIYKLWPAAAPAARK